MNNKSTKTPSRNQSLAVLLVSARPLNPDAIVRELRRAKFDVSPRYVDSVELLEAALQDHPFDVVISDHTQSQLTPEQVLTAIRDSRVDTPCIVLAETVDVEMAVGLLRQGAGDCISRRELDRLPSAVEREVREAEARRAIAEENARNARSEDTAHNEPVQAKSQARGTNGSVNGITTGGNGVSEQEISSELPAAQRDSTPSVSSSSSSQPATGSQHAAVAVAALMQELAAHTEPAAIVHHLSVHLQRLLPFDSVGISLHGNVAGNGGALHRSHPKATLGAPADTNGSSSGNVAASGTSINGSSHNGRPVNGSSGNGHSGSGHSVTVWASAAAGASGRPRENAGSNGNGAQAAPVWQIEVPLEAEGHTLGSLHFAAPRSDAFSTEQRQLAHDVASHVAVALHQSRQLRQARQIEEKYRSLFSNLDVIIWEVDPCDLRFTFVNARAEQWFGYPVERWSEDDFWTTLLHPDDRIRVLEELQRAAREGGDTQIEFQAVAADGGARCIKSIISVDMQDGQAVRMDGMMVDITEQKRSEAALLQSNAVLKATQEAAADGIFLVDDHGAVVSYNQRFIEMWRVPRDMVDSLQEKQQLMAYVLSNLKDPEEFIEKLNYTFENPYAVTHDEIYLHDGRVFSRHAAPALSPEGKSYGWVWSFSDITEHKRYELELARQASHDSLTNLPNRVLFMDRLKRAISRAGHGRTMTALLFLDLDRFKVINDSLGHEHGDRLLIELAQRLRACIRPGDTAARFGGDEFTILLEDISNVNEATRVAERIEDYLQTPFALGGHEIFSTASIGIVISTSGEDRAEVLLRHADVAMYRAKSRGGSQYEVFDSKMSSLALDRLQLEIDLRQALRRSQLRVYYQPQVEARSGQITGFEALLRWDHPLRGIISPVEFIPIAEETGMILSIGQWVLREACVQARKWQTEVPRTTPLEMSVNLSAKQFCQPGLVEEIARVLKETQFDPRSLILEITESVVMEDEVQTMTQLEALKKLGVKLAIDDFGTGYSSLAYLERFALNSLKIDRAFVNRIGERGENTAIVRAVSTLGQALGVQVTAEGVETAAQMTQLRALGCHTGQGYFFARPLPADEATTLLQENPTW